MGGPPNPQFGELVKDIHLLREPNTGAYVPARSLFSWAKTVIQESTGYYSYKGTLTLDPPLVESVTWMVFPEPIVFCCQQVQTKEFFDGQVILVNALLLTVDNSLYSLLMSIYIKKCISGGFFLSVATGNQPNIARTAK